MKQLTKVGPVSGERSPLHASGRVAAETVDEIAMNEVTERELRRLMGLWVTECEDAMAYYDRCWRLVGLGAAPRYGEHGKIVLWADRAVYRPFNALLEAEPAGVG